MTECSNEILLSSFSPRWQRR